LLKFEMHTGFVVCLWIFLPSLCACSSTGKGFLTGSKTEKTAFLTSWMMIYSWTCMP